jgi:ankyrin repeat protein
MFSAGGGHNETTRLLLDSKADVNIVVMAKPEYIEQVAKSIAEGKEDVEPHKDGVTALHVAAQGGHIGTVTMLVEAGATVRVSDDEDMTPLLNAVKGNYGNVASYLVEHGADPNDVFVDEKGKSHNLLMDAVVVSNKEFALLLIQKGANISHADAEGVTVTTQAAYQGLLPIVEALLGKEADVTVTNNEGINPLIAASSEGHHEVVKLLLSSGKGDINAKDKDGTNALMAASVRGHKEVVSQLLEKGCEVNAQVTFLLF